MKETLIDERWALLGVDWEQPSRAWQWWNRGFTASAAREWCDSGVAVSVAERWTNGGFDADQAEPWIAADASPGGGRPVTARLHRHR